MPLARWWQNQASAASGYGAEALLAGMPVPSNVTKRARAGASPSSARRI
jgi:hypothetical protein